jgi:Recombination endonuclease VII
MAAGVMINGIRIPSDMTLKKYGLTLSDWSSMALEQSYRCAVCEKTPASGIMHIHHQHVAKWKTMEPERRKQYVIALVCQFCNRFVLARTMTLLKARNIVTMLEAYEARRS